MLKILLGKIHKSNLSNLCCLLEAYFWYTNNYNIKSILISKLLEQNLLIQNLSEPAFFKISALTIFQLLYFKWTMVRHNEHSITFLQLTDLVHVLQVTLADFKPDKLLKSKEKMWSLKNIRTFVFRETVKILKCSKDNSFLRKLKNKI